MKVHIEVIGWIVGRSGCFAYLGIFLLSWEGLKGGCGNSSERNYLVGLNSLDQLRRRIEAIKKMKKPNVKWTLIVGVIIVGLAAVGLTNSRMTTTTQNPENKESTSRTISNQISHYKENPLDQSITQEVDINQLENEQLKEVLGDKNETLKNGVFGGISKDDGNYYIFINSVGYWYSNITFDIQDKLLTVKYDTEYSEGLRYKQLFLIRPKNSKPIFDKAQLINNGNRETLNVLF